MVKLLRVQVFCPPNLTKSNAADVAKRLGITTTTLYAYVNGDGTAKAAGQAIIDQHGRAD